MNIFCRLTFLCTGIFSQLPSFAGIPTTERIFEFRIYEEETLQVIEAEITIFHNSDFEVYKRLKTDNGMLRGSTEREGWFLIEINSQKHLRCTDTLWITEESEHIIQRQYSLKPIGVGHKLVFNDVRFYFNSSFMKEGSRATLDSISAFLFANPSLIVEISGHTDDEGPAEYNLALSQARAESIVKFLVMKGIAEERLIAKGYGESSPIDQGITKLAKGRNRRVEVKVIALPAPMEVE